MRVAVLERVNSKEGHVKRLTQNHWASGEMSTLQTLYKLRPYFISINLFEGISVGLETDFHHLKRIDDKSLSQA